MLGSEVDRHDFNERGIRMPLKVRRTFGDVNQLPKELASAPVRTRGSLNCIIKMRTVGSSAGYQAVSQGAGHISGPAEIGADHSARECTLT